MVSSTPKKRTVRALRGGQMTIPVEIRRDLGIAEDTLLDVEPTEDGGFVVHPVAAGRRVDDDWLHELYELFEPVRREIRESGISEDELDALIAESVAEARARRYATFPPSNVTTEELASRSE